MAKTASPTIVAAYQSFQQSAPRQVENEQLRHAMDDAKLDAQRKEIVARSAVSRVFSSIESIRMQPLEYDDLVTVDVPYETVARAKDLIINAIIRAEELQITVPMPSTSPSPSGGIHLVWRISDNWVTMSIYRPYEDTVCVTKLGKETPHRELVSDTGAINRLLDILTRANRSKNK
ncbi:MAG: hypothetical protein ACLQVD_18180 [Capsulimonadaceae bacterium]